MCLRVELARRESVCAIINNSTELNLKSETGLEPDLHL